MKNLIFTFILITLLFISCDSDPKGHIYCGEGNVYNKKLAVCVYDACKTKTQNQVCDDGCVYDPKYPKVYSCYPLSEDFKEL